MNFLPVVQRELRVAARQPRTHYTRMAAALAGMAIAGYVGLYQRRLGFGGSGGRMLFVMLTQLAAWICVLGGARLTADAISREKREGTLGFLFLSQLSGLDVVLGKLAAQATWGGYALLATMPVMAIPFLDGGVRPGEFWFAMLALANALFFSVCVGLLVSSLSTDPRRALGSATGVVLFFWLGLPLLAHLAGTAPPGSLAARLGPVCVGLSPASTTGPLAAFGVAAIKPWVPLLCTHGLGWVFLLGAAVVTRRAWRERPAGRLRERGGNWWRDFVLGRPERRAARRMAALDRNAFLWLLVRQRWKPWLPALLVVAMPMGLMLLSRATTPRGAGTEVFSTLLVPSCLLLHVLLKFWIAGEAAHAVTTLRRQGVLEVVFTTPLTFREVVQAQLLALRREFGWPLLATGVATMGGAWWYATQAYGEAGTMVLAVAAGATVALFVDTFTLAWLGTWLGLSSKKLPQAPGNTAFRVLVLPWILLALLVPALTARAWAWPEPLILWAVVGFGSDFLWWQHARQRLRTRFQAAVARAAGQWKEGK